MGVDPLLDPVLHLPNNPCGGHCHLSAQKLRLSKAVTNAKLLS